MIKKLYLPLVALLVLAFSSCSKMGELSADYFTTNPEVLEAVGGKFLLLSQVSSPKSTSKRTLSLK